MKDNSRENSNLTNIVFALGFLLVTLAILFAPKPDIKITSAGGQGAMQNTISVSGASELTVSPDQAELYLRITTEEPTATRAQEENARLTNTVKEALMSKHNINKDDIETSSFNMWPQQKYNPETRKYTETGYKVQHLLKITTTELADTGDILDTAVKNGANGIDRIQFSLSKELEADVRDQALSRAAGNAEDKAESLAQTLGVRIDGVASVTESNFYYQPYNYARTMSMDMAEGGEKSYGGTDLSPKDVEVKANLNVAYNIA